MNFKSFNGLSIILFIASFVMLSLFYSAEGKPVKPNPGAFWPTRSLWGGRITIENIEKVDVRRYDIFWGVRVGPEFTEYWPGCLPGATSYVGAWILQNGDRYFRIIRPRDNFLQSYIWFIQCESDSIGDHATLTWELENATHWFIPPDYSVVLENMAHREGYENVSLNLRQVDNYEIVFRGIHGIVFPWNATLYVDNAVNVIISPDYQENEIGDYLSYMITVQNTGRYDDSYILSASDELGWDLVLSDNLLSVPAGKSENVELTVLVGGNVTDVIKVMVVGMFASDSYIVRAKGTVSPQLGVSISVSPSKCETKPGGIATFAVTVVNMGVFEDSYDLSAVDNMGWEVALYDNEFIIPAGGSRQTTLKVVVPSDAIVDESNEVTVTVISQTDPLVGKGTKCFIKVKSEAPLSKYTWFPMAAVIILLVIASLIFARLILTRRYFS